MKLISHPIKFICTLLLILPIVSFSASYVTDLYEIAQDNVAMTSREASSTISINNQYVYTPYGQQHNLDQQAGLKDVAIGQITYRNLFDQTRAPLNISENQFGYTGQEVDSSTGLMALGRFRNYAPGVGRFIQPDTYNTFTKTSINNIYAYGVDNPLRNIDISGHDASPWNTFMDGGSFFMSLGTSVASLKKSVGAIAGFGVAWGVVSMAASALPLIAQDLGVHSKALSAATSITEALSAFGSIPIAAYSDMTRIAKIATIGAGISGGVTNIFGTISAFDPNALNYHGRNTVIHTISSASRLLGTAAMFLGMISLKSAEPVNLDQTPEEGGAENQTTVYGATDRTPIPVKREKSEADSTRSISGSSIVESPQSQVVAEVSSQPPQVPGEAESKITESPSHDEGEVGALVIKEGDTPRVREALTNSWLHWDRVNRAEIIDAEYKERAQIEGAWTVTMKV